MGRDISAKCKKCRREGAKLFLKGDRCLGSKCGVTRRNYIPGMHGPKIGRGGNRLTGYGSQLREKQKAKRTYRILERQFVKYYASAIKKTGNTASHLFEALETRLDNAIYRAGFVPSRDLARQLVNHGHFLLNGKRMDIPSYQVKIKDKITIKPSSMRLVAFQNLVEVLANKEIPEWLHVDAKELSIAVVGAPELAKSAPSFDLRAIIEFYSR
ncbi:MAG: 30S ribosomal protein S4 [Parcubacteria group bacterium]